MFIHDSFGADFSLFGTKFLQGKFLSYFFLVKIGLGGGKASGLLELYFVGGWLDFGIIRIIFTSNAEIW